jgi:hypothetical protein
MLRPEELREFLNQYEALRGIEVAYESEVKQAIAPHVVLLTGMVNIQGTPHLFETELNLTQFHTRQDLLMLGGAILKAFDKAGVETLGN